MASRKLGMIWRLLPLIFVAALPAAAQSFRVQCPTSTLTHPVAGNNNSEPGYTSATSVNGAIKCQQISGGDGYSTMGDGTQTYMFLFGPLSGLAKIASGQAGTDFPNEFNVPYAGPMLQPGDPATTVDGGSAFTYNGAIGLIYNLDANGGLGTPGPIDGHVDPRQIADI